MDREFAFFTLLIIYLILTAREVSVHDKIIRECLKFRINDFCIKMIKLSRAPFLHKEGMEPLFYQ